ncbi:methionine adenosyltransferase [Acidobacteria bacterium AH-259-A15]|nr:methionine adenosyltransferase [Acidobacteria bacterium AH-259-A15]
MAKAAKQLFTSESVTEGHPDKIADQISDAILDTILEEDPYGRVACETLVTTGLVVIAGEITTDCHVDYAGVARGVIRDVGYTRAKYGFDCETCGVICSIDRQSPDIAQGVDKGGAGDQGLMFGYACSETPQLMPMPIILAHQLTQRLTHCRREGIIDWLRPDGKSQVTIEYDGDKPARLDTAVISAQHSPDVSSEAIRETIREKVIKAVVSEELIDEDTNFYINPTGRFVVGGPQGDCGMTGRKIIVDTYGGVGSHGGGALSGKDPSKVDRSASYMARYIAKNCVAAGLAERMEIQLAYVIGVPDPISITLDAYGTESVNPETIGELIRAYFKLTPHEIIEALNLRRPIFRKTAAYGHFGREEEGFTWELTDKADLLRREAGLSEVDAKQVIG